MSDSTTPASEAAVEPSECPCGSGSALDDCCGRFIRGGAVPDTAEALMRSRYSAYVLGDIDYIVASHEPKGRGDIDRAASESWAKESEWLGLEIRNTTGGGPDDEEGMVEFVARYRIKGNEFPHHERAAFRKVDGRWYYVDGAMVKPKPVVRDRPKVGRNEPCPCGSGKKYKKCCGKAA